jgi:YafQ family addiction module toxin component
VIVVVYSLKISATCQKEIKRLTIKNSHLQSIVTKKIAEILEHPTRYKPLRNELAGYYRVHIMTSFVLVFAVDIEERTVTLVHFAHHNGAYEI